MVQEDEADKDLLKMQIGGIQPGQEVIVKVVLVKLLDIEASAYCLRVPTSYVIKNELEVPDSISTDPISGTYNFRVEVHTQTSLLYISVPSHSQVTKILKKAGEPQAGYCHQVTIEKINASTKDLTKDLLVYFRTHLMDRP